MTHIHILLTLATYPPQSLIDSKNWSKKFLARKSIADLCDHYSRENSRERRRRRWSERARQLLLPALIPAGTKNAGTQAIGRSVHEGPRAAQKHTCTHLPRRTTFRIRSLRSTAVEFGRVAILRCATRITYYVSRVFLRLCPVPIRYLWRDLSASACCAYQRACLLCVCKSVWTILPPWFSTIAC